MDDPVLDTLIAVLAAQPRVEVAWLYGSRATGRQDPASDYDVAVALTGRETVHLSATMLVEDLGADLSERAGAAVSIVDINRIPVPLAYAVISDGKTLVCRSDFRLRTEQQRVWSLWEAYKGEHERNRSAL